MKQKQNKTKQNRIFSRVLTLPETTALSMAAKLQPPRPSIVSK
jgi:hypothetical protein